MEQVVELLKTISGQLVEVIENQKRLPLVYSVNMGTLQEVAGAPQAVFTPDFLERVGSDIKQIVNPLFVEASKQVQKQNKSIDLTKSNEYRKPKAEA